MHSSLKSIGAIADILQVSPDTDSLISNGYHNNLKMSQSCDSLPILKIDLITNMYNGHRRVNLILDHCQIILDYLDTQLLRSPTPIPFGKIDPPDRVTAPDVLNKR
jgi:hypothetical protein